MMIYKTPETWWATKNYPHKYTGIEGFILHLSLKFNEVSFK